jgi:hypothetical protein
MYLLLKKLEHFLLYLLKVCTNSTSQNKPIKNSGSSLFTTSESLQLFADLEIKTKKSQKAKTALITVFTLALLIAISLLVLKSVEFDLVSFVRN